MSEANGAEIVRLEAPSSRAIITREALKADTEQRALVAEYVRRHMVEGVDYGKIPGTDKPTLLKPGAEKLVDLFRCKPRFALIKDEEDFDRGHGFFNYKFRVRLEQRDSGAVVAEGFGSANSREGRYRWRDAQRKCPNCSKATIIKGKAEYGGGWLCFAKKGGCGAKFATGDQTIEGQVQGRVENDDVATLANTILKMAKKRALVDGAIALARCSDMFTQDVEDLMDVAPEEPVVSGKKTAPAPAARVAKVADTGEPPPPSDADAPPVESNSTPPPKQATGGEPGEFEQICIAIGEATEQAHLKALVARIQNFNKWAPKEQQAEVRALYAAKQKDILARAKK